MFSKLLLLAAPFVAAQFAPVTFDTNKSPACKPITCQPLECPPGFSWTKPGEGTNSGCCPICYNEALAAEAGASDAAMPVGFAHHPNAPMNCKASDAGAQRTWCPDVSGTCADADKVYKDGSCCMICSDPALPEKPAESNV